MASTVSAKQRAEFEAIFAEVDTDKSGLIDKGELRAAMEKGGMKPTDAEVDGLVAEFDTSGKGEFTKEDFVQMMVRQTQTSEAELIKESFKIIDSEKTAFIDAEALKNALSSAGVEGFSDDDIAAAIRQASSGGDKTKIDLEEFTKLWAEVKP